MDDELNISSRLVTFLWAEQHSKARQCGPRVRCFFGYTLMWLTLLLELDSRTRAQAT